jgi:LysR family transcriptional regulator, glycine cleavage system transcriptional activator
MHEQSNNLHPGHASGTYPLSQMTKALPSLAGLQAFVAATHYRSISKAATHLCRTQGAVSRQVQQLETHYRCALFTRSASGLTLTRQGETLRDVALQVLSLLVRHEHELDVSASLLSLRVPSTFGVRWLLPRLHAINAALSGTEVRIVTSSDDTPDFSDPDIDAIVVRGAGEWPGLDSVLLFKEVLTPMCAPSLAASLLSPRDLASAKLLHPGTGCAEWRCWLKYVGIDGIDLGRGLVFDTLDLTLTAATQGHGVAIGDPRMAVDRLARNELVMPFSQKVENGAAYYLVVPPQRAQTQIIRTLADALLQLIGESDPSSKPGRRLE